MTKISVNCSHCNKNFLKRSSDVKRTKNHFCTRSCSACFNNRGIQHNKPKQLICTSCNNAYTRNYKHKSIKFCHNCFKLHGPNRYKFIPVKVYKQKLSVKGKHSSWLNAHIRNFNRQWNKNLLTNGCQKCNYNKHCELAHIKPINKFTDEITLGEINSPNNILVLCPNHHWEFDNGHLLLSDIPPRSNPLS